MRDHSDAKEHPNGLRACPTDTESAEVQKSRPLKRRQLRIWRTQTSNSDDSFAFGEHRRQEARAVSRTARAATPAPRRERDFGPKCEQASRTAYPAGLGHGRRACPLFTLPLGPQRPHVEGNYMKKLKGDRSTSQPRRIQKDTKSCLDGSCGANMCDAVTFDQGKFVGRSFSSNWRM